MARKKDNTIHRCKECVYCTIAEESPHSRSIDGKPILGVCKFEKYKVVLNYKSCYRFKQRV
mgnify:CR=1 FL=1